MPGIYPGVKNARPRAFTANRRKGRLGRALLRPATPYLLVGPTLVTLALFQGYPLMANLYMSMFSWRFTNPSSTRFVGLGNFVDLFTDPGFWDATTFTMVFIVGTIGAELIFGLTAALLLVPLKRTRGALVTVVLIPYLVASVAVGLTWRLLWNYDFGLVNWLISQLGAAPVNWLGDATFARIAIIVTEVWRSTPFVAVILLAGLTQIPSEVLEAGRVDGAGGWKMLSQLILPLLRPSLSVALLFQTVFKLRAFDMPFTLTQGGPGLSTTPYGILLYRTYFRFFDGGQAAALAVVLLLLGAVVAMAYLKLLYREVRY